MSASVFRPRPVPGNPRRGARPVQPVSGRIPPQDRRGARLPEAFVTALTQAGWLAALIPQEYGGPGLSMAEASVIMEEINRSGGNSGACHGQMYVMNTIVFSGTSAEAALPAAHRGGRAACAVDGRDRHHRQRHRKLKTTAVKKEGRWVINGQKVWISRVQHSDLLILLARTTPLDQVQKKSDGLSCFIVELDKAIGNGLTVRPILNMVNHETNELFFDNGAAGRRVARHRRQGAEGDLRRPERRAHADRGRVHRRRLLVSGESARLCGRAQGVRPPDRAEPGHPVSARRIVHRAGGREPDALARLRRSTRARTPGSRPTWPSPAAKASWEAANACLQTHGGFGFACEYDVERKFRETRL